MCATAACDQPADHDAVVVATSRDDGRTFRQHRGGARLRLPGQRRRRQQRADRRELPDQQLPAADLRPRHRPALGDLGRRPQRRATATATSVKTNGDAFLSGSDGRHGWSKPATIGTRRRRGVPGRRGAGRAGRGQRSTPAPTTRTASASTTPTRPAGATALVGAAPPDHDADGEPAGPVRRHRRGDRQGAAGRVHRRLHGGRRSAATSGCTRAGPTSAATRARRCPTRTSGRRRCRCSRTRSIRPLAALGAAGSGISRDWRGISRDPCGQARATWRRRRCRLRRFAWGSGPGRPGRTACVAASVIVSVMRGRHLGSQRGRGVDDHLVVLEEHQLRPLVPRWRACAAGWPASSPSMSAALAWTTKLRVNRPQLARGLARPALAALVAACPPSARATPPTARARSGRAATVRARRARPLRAPCST